MQEIPQEEGLLIDVAQASSPRRAAPMMKKVAVVCGCAALVMVGYVMGSRHSYSALRSEAVISKVGAILSQDDFSSLYAKVIATGLTNAELSAINSQITGTGTATNANVKLLKSWYADGTDSNKIFANKLIVKSVASSSKTTAATTSTGTVVSKVGAILSQDDFSSLYAKVIAT